MHFKSQSSNSPDFNVLDLSFIQLQQDNIDEVIETVTKAYWNINWETLGNIYLSFKLYIEPTLLNKYCDGY